MSHSILPSLNASLNATSALLLILGVIFIRQRAIKAHTMCMAGAFLCSTLFLISYLYYHAHHGSTPFPGQGLIRPLYFAMLISHIVLAVLVLPLALITLYQAFRGQFLKHKKIARITFPIWLYVSATGVLIYWLLYHVYA